ncbi:MAG: hypothetical protein COV10_02520 [Candidatus Vogelbacteria bacterium CG10_big_fil_rev_8_21_14_0_10_51_16]|uniref:Guanylate cyclase domain-containing protein n=1 Tax=Candidatus Vogelbacteria bacterium CG10_big_fil_rev_8_21_14_0_10_51_16 TaxID=1975045 RepID=A0A2H0REE8_9BACT|nr:MAG: hypothetical protein COV10_02520 [Candidatus Vogelbacteria bacterium CG10_big_fil_rev_8_21_14_0_10_51_16]
MKELLRTGATQLLVAAIIGLLVVGTYALGYFGSYQLLFEDLLFSERPVDDSLVIVAIDNESLATIGQWPWPREVFAKALANLQTVAPATVGLDVIFADPSRIGEADDAALERVLRGLSYPIVMPIEGVGERGARVGGMTSDNQELRLVEPLSRFTAHEAVHLGHVNLLLDRDATARRLPLAIQVGAEEIPAFATEVARLSGKKVRLSPSLYYGPTPRVVYAGPPGTVPQLSFVDLYNGEPSALRALTGKIVFVGATAADLHDEQATPFSRGTLMSGVEIQAQATNMFLVGSRLVPLAPLTMAALLLLAALISALFFLFVRRPLVAVGVNVLIGLLYLPLTIFLFNRGVLVSFLHLQLAWILATATLFGYRYLSVERERREMRNAFSKYVSRDVLAEILADPSKVKLGGDEYEATVFFSDVRGFTTLSETLTPTELVSFLNRYLSVMTDITIEERGVIDKYIGDAIMGFWGAPIRTETHAIDAVRASLLMVEALDAFNAESKAAGGLVIDIGIGINTGKVTAGNMGSERRFDYTVMGDAVNLASRLEGQTKSYGIHILVSEYTYAALPKEILEREQIVTRELDQIKVKGKKMPVRVFQIVDRDKAETVRPILTRFNELRELYYRGAWDGCIKLGEQILALSDDGPTKALTERARYFKEHPPEHWGGVYELKTK